MANEIFTPKPSKENSEEVKAIILKSKQKLEAEIAAKQANQ